MARRAQMALFLIGLPLVIRGIGLPVGSESFNVLAEHLGYAQPGSAQPRQNRVCGSPGRPTEPARVVSRACRISRGPSQASRFIQWSFLERARGRSYFP
jgi:hypothetical protein